VHKPAATETVTVWEIVFPVALCLLATLWTMR
jgi:hypothetical protein